MKWIFAITFAIMFALILLSPTIGYSFQAGFQAGNNSARPTYTIGIKMPPHQPAVVIGRATSANITPVQTKTNPSAQLPSIERSITSPPNGKYVVNLTNNMTSQNLFKAGVGNRKERPGELIEKATRWVEQVPAQVQLPSNAPEIIGDGNLVAKINLALDLLKRKAPKQYEIVGEYIKVIQAVDKGSAMYAWENPPRFAIGKKSVNLYGVGSEMRPIILASTILHDAIHSKLYNDYLSKHPGSTVPKNVYSGRDAERLCLAQQYDASRKMGGNQWILKYIKNSINNKYYEVPVEKRDW